MNQADQGHVVCRKLDGRSPAKSVLRIQTLCVRQPVVDVIEQVRAAQVGSLITLREHVPGGGAVAPVAAPVQVRRTVRALAQFAQRPDIAEAREFIAQSASDADEHAGNQRLEQDGNRRFPSLEVKGEIIVVHQIVEVRVEQIVPIWQRRT